MMNEQIVQLHNVNWADISNDRTLALLAAEVLACAATIISNEDFVDENVQQLIIAELQERSTWIAQEFGGGWMNK